MDSHLCLILRGFGARLVTLLYVCVGHETEDGRFGHVRPFLLVGRAAHCFVVYFL